MTGSDVSGRVLVIALAAAVVAVVLLVVGIHGLVRAVLAVAP